VVPKSRHLPPGDDIVRRRLIRFLLPLVFCVLPVLAAVLIIVSLPADARDFYFQRISGQNAGIDHLILGLGCTLFLVQMVFTWRALRWRGTGFDERPDRWLSNLAQAAEWFPLLGLLGTVAGIMDTFYSIKGPTEQHVIINKYAPAITATGSGLFMALLNILPTWIVMIGRDLILTLGGDAPAAPPAPPAAAQAPPGVPATPRSTPAARH
jgi:hypothetical protein